MLALDIGYNFPVTWQAPNLLLADAAWKNNVSGVYRVNTGRNGLVSFKPGSLFNNLLELVTGESYIFIVNEAFELAGAGIGPRRPPFSFAIDGQETVEGETLFLVPSRTFLLDAPARLSTDFSAGSGAVHVSADGANWTIVGPGGLDVEPAELRFRVQHPAGAAFYVTVTLTYA